MKALLPMALMVAASAMPMEEHSPYAGAEDREIKALSADRIAGYLAGAGMGYAKAAELNHYPGPKHVLELAEALGLSQSQLASTQRLFDGMQNRASELGRQLVAAERALDRQFAENAITPESLAERVTEIARLEGALRTTHLSAHLAQKQILTADQLRRYDRLRGYAGGGHHGREH